MMLMNEELGESKEAKSRPKGKVCVGVFLKQSLAFAGFKNIRRLKGTQALVWQNVKSYILSMVASLHLLLA